MLGNAAAMGWPPAALLQSSYEDYIAALQGWNRSRMGVRYSTPESIQEGLDLVEWERRRNAERHG